MPQKFVRYRTLSGALTTRASSSASAISARTRWSFASSRAQLISAPAPAKPAPPLFVSLRRAYGSCVVAPGANARRRRLAVALLPRDHRVAEDADALDLRLD